MEPDMFFAGGVENKLLTRFKKSEKEGLWTRFLNLVIRVLKLSFKFGPSLFFLPLLWLPDGVAPHRLWWQYSLWAIETSGPTIIKLAQWAGSRRDIFPIHIIEHLSKLHDDVPPHSIQETYRVLDEEYGGRDAWRGWLEVPDEKPVGSGAIGQVYKARADVEGKGSFRDVALKVCHPGHREAIEVDLDILRTIGWAVDSLPLLRHLGVGDMVEQFSDFITAQSDLTQEAENILRFRKIFRSHHNVSFPEVFPSLCRPSVLVESFEEGRQVSEILNALGPGKSLEELSIHQTLKKAACRAGSEAFLEMLFVSNFVHGDLHPGNMLVETDQKGKLRNLCLLDCGLATELSEADLANFVDLFSAMAWGKWGKIGELMIERGRTPRQLVLNPEEFCEKTEKLVRETFEGAGGAFNFRGLEIGAVLSKMLQLACAHRVRLEPNFVSVVTSIIVIEGVGKTLDPSFDVIKESRPFLVRAAMKRMGAKRSGPAPVLSEEEIALELGL